MKIQIGKWATITTNYGNFENVKIKDERDVEYWEEDVDSGEIESIEEWKPRKGEECIFWCEEPIQRYVIAEFKDEFDGGYGARDGGCFHNVAPIEFAQTLKAK